MAEADLMPITKILITFYKLNLCQEGYILLSMAHIHYFNYCSAIITAEPIKHL